MTLKKKKDNILYLTLMLDKIMTPEHYYFLVLRTSVYVKWQMRIEVAYGIKIAN